MRILLRYKAEIAMKLRLGWSQHGFCFMMERILASRSDNIHHTFGASDPLTRNSGPDFSIFKHW